ncbi:MAG: hypothetical protein JNM93_13815 [Bacteriovoracaceae bacterium]|nr:hypothetical protein [Bacteriovoracaceae bacterium]
MKSIIGLLALLLVTSCASKKLKETDNSETIKKDYEVRDASSTTRPAWIEDANQWAEENDQDTKGFRHFSYETEPKVNRNFACDFAKANIKSDIAGEISTYLEKSLGSSQEGSASIDENNPEIVALREFVENTLAEKIQGLIIGAEIRKTYWEKRAYMKRLGAAKDFIGFTCAALVRIPNERLQAALDRASKIVSEKVDDPETKENVENALKKAEENFLKTKQGLL